MVTSRARFEASDAGRLAQSAARSDLAKVLTAEQIQQFLDSLHMHGGGGHGE